jgi:hypothetical protein
VTDTRAHAAHLAVAPFAQRDRETRQLVPPLANAAGTTDAGRRRARTVEKDAMAKLVEVFVGGHPDDDRLVHPLDLVPGMRQPGSKVAIARQQQQTLAVVVEAADGVEVFPHAAQQLHDCASTFRISPGGHHVLRLVQQDVPGANIEAEATAIHLDDVRRRVGFASQRPHDLAVDLDTPLRDELFRGASRRDPGHRQEFL